MAAEVETMFYTREKPWHGLGTLVAEAPESREALRIAGLNWKVLQEPVYTENDELIQGYKANVRDSDRKILGVVTDRYKVIQNEEAFAFTDASVRRRSALRNSWLPAGGEKGVAACKTSKGIYHCWRAYQPIHGIFQYP